MLYHRKYSLEELNELFAIEAFKEKTEDELLIERREYLIKVLDVRKKIRKLMPNAPHGLAFALYLQKYCTKEERKILSDIIINKIEFDSVEDLRIYLEYNKCKITKTTKNSYTFLKLDNKINKCFMEDLRFICKEYRYFNYNITKNKVSIYFK